MRSARSRNPSKELALVLDYVAGVDPEWSVTPGRGSTTLDLHPRDPPDLPNHDRALQRLVLGEIVVVEAAAADRVQVARFALLAGRQVSDLVELDAVRMLGMRI
jgi:hypothetical protein